MRTAILASLFAIGLSALALAQSTPPAEFTAEGIAIADAILTMDPQQPEVQALAWRKGRLIHCGSVEGAMALRGEKTQVFDFEGRTLVPGFIDAHCHPAPIYPFESPHHTLSLGPSDVSTLDELIERLRQKAAITPKGEWIVGRGYEDTKLGRHPTREDLDRASTEHLIKIGHSSSHMAVFNSLAFERAKVTEKTPDPPGGAYGRDAKGRPNGLCQEGASSNLQVRLPRRKEPSAQDIREGLRRCAQDFLKKGITTLAEAGTGGTRHKEWQDLHADGLRLRVALYFRESYAETLSKIGLRAGAGDEWIRLLGIKLFHGNSLSGRTCWLYEPYADRPDYFGIPPARSQDALNDLVLEIHRAGLQLAIHANGDREIDMVLDVYERALLASPRADHRHRIEHGSVSSAKILDRMQRLGVALAPHSYIYEHGDKMEAYGEARFDWMHPNRAALARGILVAGNSDYPVSAADPMLRIQSLVTRTSSAGKVYGASQRLSVEQALHTFTHGAAKALFFERDVGQLKPGLCTDFVVLERDPRQTEPLKLREVAVVQTFVGGLRADGP